MASGWKERTTTPFCSPKRTGCAPSTACGLCDMIVAQRFHQCNGSPVRAAADGIGGRRRYGRQVHQDYHVAKQYQRVGRNIDTTTLRHTVSLLSGVDDFLPMPKAPGSTSCSAGSRRWDGGHREMTRAIAGVQQKQQRLATIGAPTLVDVVGGVTGDQHTEQVIATVTPIVNRQFCPVRTEPHHVFEALVAHRIAGEKAMPTEDGVRFGNTQDFAREVQQDQTARSSRSQFTQEIGLSWQ